MRVLRRPHVRGIVHSARPCPDDVLTVQGAMVRLAQQRAGTQT